MYRMGRTYRNGFDLRLDGHLDEIAIGWHAVSFAQYLRSVGRGVADGDQFRLDETGKRVRMDRSYLPTSNYSRSDPLRFQVRAPSIGSGGVI